MRNNVINLQQDNAKPHLASNNVVEISDNKEHKFKCVIFDFFLVPINRFSINIDEIIETVTRAYLNINW